VVAEMRKHFRVGDIEKFQQIKKYDSDLKGWWTRSGRITNHDLVLLTHFFSSVDARDAYLEWTGKGGVFSRRFAIVEFTYSQQGQNYFVLRRVEGGLSDTAHDAALRKGKKIADQVFIDLTSKYKFYDDDPPLIQMLLLIQTGVMPRLFSETDYGRLMEGETPSVVTSVERVRDILHQLYCDPPQAERQPDLPRAKWVVRALDTLVDIGMAHRLGGKKSQYELFLSRPPRDKDLVSFFSRKLHRRGGRTRAAEESGGQATLFPDREGE
jgi:hypothetical protein